MNEERGPFDWNAFMWWVSLTVLGVMAAMIMVIIVVVGLGVPILGIAGDDQVAPTALQVGVSPIFALGGAIVGLAQWLVLRGQFPRAGWWILATASGWLAGYLWAYILVPPSGGTANIVEALFPWLLIGLLTGLCQWLILRNYYHGSALWVPTAALAMLIGTTGLLLGGTYGGAFLWLVVGGVSGWILFRVLPPRRDWPEK